MKTLIIFVLTLILPISSCLSQPVYNAAIQEGKIAAQEFIAQKKATAITIALVAPDHIIWSETFGLADPLTGEAATDNTLFGIGSVSKLLPVITIMKLVEQGRINLDEPVVTYLPAFTMASPEYRNITVRMLLNHSAGFPGTDYRNADIRSFYPGYLDQVIQTLSQSRLKAPPGYMNVYCNDCFTLLEAVIMSVTGKSYTDAIQDEIFTPLRMNNSHYPVSPFPQNSYAKAYVNEIIRPQEYVNTFASGGAYSTAKDMARIIMMFLNDGIVDNTRILLPSSIAEMAKDQTQGTFNPVRNNSFALGLGWDSVSQPGLLAVGFDGWAKGGDSNDYGAMLIVSPKAKLGVIVIGVSSFGSENAKIIAERILLRALAENNLIPAFPSPIKGSVNSPLTYPTSELPNKEYALFDQILNFQLKHGGTTLTTTLTDQGWKPLGHPLQRQANEWYIDPGMPAIEVKTVDANALGVNTQYLLRRMPQGYGHYLDSLVLAQKLQAQPHKLSSAWKSRIRSTWLVVNEHPDELAWNGMDPRLRLTTVGYTNLIAVRAPEDGKFHIVNPSASDTEAKMMLIIPQLNGRDLNDLVIIKRDGKEWVRYGSYMHRPLATVPKLILGKPDTVTIGTEGYAEWRAIESSLRSIHVTIKTDGEWRLYDREFNTLAQGKGDATATIPSGQGLNYLTIFGNAGARIDLQTSH